MDFPVINIGNTQEVSAFPGLRQVVKTFGDWVLRKGET